MGLVAPHVGSSQTRDQTCVSCIGRWTLIPLSQQGTPYPTFRFLYFVVCLLFVVVLLFVVHVHISFRSSTSQRCGMYPHHQSAHDTGLKKYVCMPVSPRNLVASERQRVGVLLTSVSLSPARGCTFTAHAPTRSHQVTGGNTQSFWEELYDLQTSWRGHKMKRSPHCLCPC